MGKSKEDKKRDRLASESARVGCARPGKCCYGEEIATDNPGDAQRLICSNADKCIQTNLYIHEKCLANWEAELVLAIERSGGRGKKATWSEQQRFNNLWIQKGYELIYRLCGCVCGGYLRKDIDYCHSKIKKADSSEKMRKKRKNKNLPTLGSGGSASTYPVTPSKSRPSPPRNDNTVYKPVASGSVAAPTRTITCHPKSKTSICSEASSFADIWTDMEEEQTDETAVDTSPISCGEEETSEWQVVGKKKRTPPKAQICRKQTKTVKRRAEHLVLPPRLARQVSKVGTALQQKHSLMKSHELQNNIETVENVLKQPLKSYTVLKNDKILAGKAQKIQNKQDEFSLAKPQANSLKQQRVGHSKDISAVESVASNVQSENSHEQGEFESTEVDLNLTASKKESGLARDELGIDCHVNYDLLSCSESNFSRMAIMLEVVVCRIRGVSVFDDC